MFGRFIKRQIRKSARKVLPAPINKFPGPVGYPHVAMKKILDATDNIGKEDQWQR